MELRKEVFQGRYHPVEELDQPERQVTEPEPVPV